MQSLYIALVTHGSESSDRGGPTTRTENLRHKLRAHGHRVDLLHNIAEHQTSTQYDIIHVFNSWPVDSAIKQLLLARASGARVIFSPIALDLYNTTLASTVIPALLEQSSSLSQAKRAIEFVRDLTPVRAFRDDRSGPNFEGLPGHHSALRRAISLADHIICLSHFEQSFLRSIDANSKPITIVRNGAQRIAFDAGLAKKFKEHFQIENFALCLGRLEPRKNQAALAISASMASVPLICIGGAPNARYADLVRRWAPNEYIHIPHSNDKKLLQGAFSAASMFCLPSWSEGAPMAALEAAHAGTPLLLSTMSGEIEYFQDAAKYVHPCDISTISNAMSKAIQEDGESADRAPIIDERFSTEAHAMDTLKLYEKVVAAQPSKSKQTDASPAPIAQNTQSLTHSEFIVLKQNKIYRLLYASKMKRENDGLIFLYRLIKIYQFRLRQFLFRDKKTRTRIEFKSSTERMEPDRYSRVETTFSDEFLFKVYLTSNHSDGGTGPNQKKYLKAITNAPG